MTAKLIIAAWIALLIIGTTLRWWIWPDVARRFAGDSRESIDMLGVRGQLRMHESACKRALCRYATETGEDIQFVRLARPPLRLFLWRNLFSWRSVTWGLARADSGEVLFCLRGWFSSDKAIPEFFDV